MAQYQTWPQDTLHALILVCANIAWQKQSLTEMQVWQLAWRRTTMAWFYVPVGLLCVLLACWGVDSLIGLSSVSFPASVALLIVLFFALTLCETALGDKRTRKIVQIIDIPVRCKEL